MKSAALLLAALRDRDLEESARRIAGEHHVALETAMSSSHEAEIVRARHAIWLDQVDALGSASAVARLWGVTHGTILAALSERTQIVGVLLARSGEYAFRWIAGDEHPFKISDSDRSLSFKTYEAARLVWTECLEQNGASFRRRSAELLEPPGAPATSSPDDDLLALGIRPIRGLSTNGGAS